MAARSSKPKNKGGRPPVKIDLAELEKLAQLGCTQDEAAAWFGVSRQTLSTRMTKAEYRDIWDRGQGKAKISLRRHQFKLAEKNATMAIFLGKNMLGQTDKQEHIHTDPDGGPPTFTFHIDNANATED